MADVPARDWAAHAAHRSTILADDTVIARTTLVDGQVAGNVVSWDDAARRKVGYWVGRQSGAGASLRKCWGRSCARWRRGPSMPAPLCTTPPRSESYRSATSRSCRPPGPAPDGHVEVLLELREG